MCLSGVEQEAIGVIRDDDDGLDSGYDSMRGQKSRVKEL